MALKIVRNDITKIQADAIVNTANKKPTYSSGIDAAVYKAAGEELLLLERQKIGFMNEGEVAITPGFHLPAKYIIHAISPYYIDGNCGEEKKLRQCYKESLQLAYDNNCKSIAFPLIGTGNMGYPKEEGMLIAVEEIKAFLFEHDNMTVYLVVFDTESTKLGLNFYPELEMYIDHNYVCDKYKEEYGGKYYRSRLYNSSEYDLYSQEQTVAKRGTVSPNADIDKYGIPATAFFVPGVTAIPTFMDKTDASGNGIINEPFSEKSETLLNERINHLSDSFQQYLLVMIKKKGLTNSEVYKTALVSKQLFSRIKLNPEYHPDKATALRLCVGARLNLDETKDLLARAGYALSPCDKRDVIFSFFIEHGIFDIIEIDIALEEYGLQCFIS